MKWKDLWSNARYSRLGPVLRSGQSYTQGAGLFLGGLNLLEPYSRVYDDLSVDQAQAISAVRGIKLTTATAAAGWGAESGLAIASSLGVSSALASAASAGVGAVILGGIVAWLATKGESKVYKWAEWED